MKNNTISLQTRNLRSLFLLLGLIFVYLNPVYGQNCYVRLSDVSGITPTQAQLDSLEYAACRLRESLPDTFQNDFRVFDFGFYLHNETMIGGYPEAFQEAINQVNATAKYYLLVGKQIDKNGMFTKFWIDMKLPSTLLCNGQNQIATISDNIRWSIEDEFINQKKIIKVFYKAELIGINYLKDKIENLVICCGLGQNKSTQQCPECPDDNEVKRLLLEKGFSMSDVDSFSVTIQSSKKMFPDLVEGKSLVKIWKNNFQIDLNAQLSSMLQNDISVEPKRGAIGSDYDMCYTDLYEKIRNGYFNTFKFAFVQILWTRKDGLGKIVETKLFTKYFLNELTLDINNITPYSELQQKVLRCWPEFGKYNLIDTPYPLPQKGEYNNQYFISNEINSYSESKYSCYGYLYNSQLKKWIKGDSTQIYIKLSGDGSDGKYADCNNYPIAEWQSYAKNLNIVPTDQLNFIFKFWTINNLAVSYEKTLHFLKPIINQYYYFHGDTLKWKAKDDFSKYIYSQDQINKFIKRIEYYIHEWLNSHDNFQGFIANKQNEISNDPELARNLPLNPLTSTLSEKLKHPTAAIAIGGIQGWMIRIISLKKLSFCLDGDNNTCYEVELMFTLEDEFGAGTNDRDRGGLYPHEGMIPGLAEMWILQHCRNFDCDCIGAQSPPCFVPFPHRLTFGHIFKLCYKK